MERSAQIRTGYRSRPLMLILLTAVLCMGCIAFAQDSSGQETDGNASVRQCELNEIFFDTFVSIRFDAGENGEELTDGCRSICEEIENTFSRTDENSELYAVNHRDSDRVEVSGPLAEVVQAGLDYGKMSDGRFDITIAPLSEIWDFHSEDPSVPPETEIQNALRKVDGSAVHVEQNQDTWYLAFDRPDIMLDLGALAKGYAADCLADYLKSNGVTSGLINLGGNVAAIGTKADGSPWKIGVQKPFDTDIADAVEITDQSVVTSGVYERCFEQDGILYHHILDPSTGYPVTNGLWGVTIICDSSLQADALSTACLLLGREEAINLLRQVDGVRAVFIDDQLQVTEYG